MNGQSEGRKKTVWRGGLRSKIIVWSFVPTAIILLAVALVTFFAFQSAVEELVLERGLDVVFVSANRLAEKLREYEELLATVAHSEDLVQGDPETQQEALERAANRLMIFDGGVMFLDSFGRVIAAEPERPQLVDQTWSDRSYYQNVVRSQIAGSTPRSAFSEILADGPEGSEVIVLALPVVGEHDQFLGVLAGMFRVGPAATNTFYDDIVTLRSGQSGSAYLVDNAGRVIYHSDAGYIGDDFSTKPMVEQVLSAQVDAVRARDAEGNDIVAGYAPIPGTPWGLVSEEKWAAVTGSFQGYRNFLLLLLVLGVVAPAIVVGIGVRRITQPIVDLIGAAQEVARGNFGQKIGAETGDELEELAEQFNFMSDQLRASYANLEQRVADRTRELATLNAIAAAVSRSLDLDEILSDALDETLALLDVEGGAILLIEPGGDLMSPRVTRGFSDEFLQAVPRIHIDEGISGQAIAQGKPVVLDVEDYARGEPTEHVASAVFKEGVQTLASAPLLHTGEALGVLNLITRRSRAFPPQELELLTAIGHQIGVAVENARLYEQVQQELVERTRAEAELRRVGDEHARRNRELVLLNRVIADTTSRMDPHAVLEAVCRELALAFDVPEVGAALLNEGDDTLTVVAEYLLEGRPSALGAVFPVRGYPSAEYVLEHNAPLAVADAQHDPRMEPVHELMRQRGTASLLILPLTVREEVVGTIGMVAVEIRQFTDEEISLANNAAAAASQALERARAEEALRHSQERLSLHVQHTPLAYIEWDADLRVVDWNPSAERIFGYSEREAQDRHAYELIVPPEVQPQVTEVWHDILNQSGGTHSSNENITKDGRTIVCEWYNTPLIDRDGQVIGLASLVQDITERVQAEEALRETTDAAEAANRAKSFFLANMSHELRTPLNAILGFAQLMARDSDLTTEQRESLEIIGLSGEHLLALINDVLEMSKIEAGRVTLQEQSFDLYRMLDGLKEMFLLRAKNRGLSLFFDRSADVPQYVRADEGKLRQVLMNLLGNAIKFTAQGGITARVGRSQLPESSEFALHPDAERERQREDTLRLRFEVQDTGSGIAPEELAAIFDPFVQTAAGRKSQQGTGLGLSISRRFVRLMGGDFVVSSEEGQGSVFSFDVPVELAEATAIVAAQPARRVLGLEPNQPVFRVLVAEDQETNRKLLVNLLASLGAPPSGASDDLEQGLELREAANGQEALEIWERWEPHLIWMDLRMPIMDGFEATRRIKATSRGRDTVIVALTASAFERDRETVLAQGCDDFVRKPFRAEEIFDILAKHLDLRFLYEDQSDEHPSAAVPTPRGELAVANLKALPRDWTEELYRAATQLDAEVVLDLADKIRDQSASVADALVGLVHDFRFDTLIALLESLENEYES